MNCTHLHWLMKNKPMIFQNEMQKIKLHSTDWLMKMHYDDLIMGTMASQITSLTIVCSTVSSDPDQRKHQSSVTLAFVWGMHQWLVNSPHKWPVMRKMFQFDDVIMELKIFQNQSAKMRKPILHHCQPYSMLFSKQWFISVKIKSIKV